MGKSSAPRKDVFRYSTETGGVVTLTMTFVDHFSDLPNTSSIDNQELVNIELSGDISEEDADEALQWIVNGYQGQTPAFLQTLQQIFPA